MADALGTIRTSALDAIGAARSSAELEEVRVRYLGRKGELTRILRSLGELPEERRPEAGKAANELRRELQEAIDSRSAALRAQEAGASLAAEALDVTLPGRWHPLGRRHPLTLIADELKAIFIGLGYEVVEGRDVEYYKYNFEVLNYPHEHPAMDEQDSFYVTDDILLRTHTSAVQVREMEKRTPPFRVCTWGRCFRREAVSARASHTFHHFEAFVVDEGISFADLKGTLILLARELFGPDTQVRLRPDFFPFTEPSAEYSVTCLLCKGKGCTLCKYTGLLEVGGCGLIHPNVLRAGGIDPEKYSGWAFGLGTDRLAMLRYGIDDIRLFMENDVRFLHQF